MKEASREQLRAAPLGALRQAMEVLSNEIERNEEEIKSKRAGLAELKAAYFERLDGGEVEGDALSELEKLIKWGQGVSSKTYPTRSAPGPELLTPQESPAPPSSSPALCVLCQKREGSCCPLCNKGPYCQRCAEGEGLFCCDNGKPIAGGVQ